MLAAPPGHASPAHSSTDEFPEFCNSNVVPQSDVLELLAAPTGHASPVCLEDCEFPKYCENSNVVPQSEGLEMPAAPSGQASPAGYFVALVPQSFASVPDHATPGAPVATKRWGKSAAKSKNAHALQEWDYLAAQPDAHVQQLLAMRWHDQYS
eukprot:1589743-Karenia_brevis.AAC.1